MRASDPSSEVIHVIGMYLRTLPIQRMSWLWCMPMITEPAARNSSALKKACVIRWNTATLYAEAPSATVMYPSCDSVEYATTRLMSFWMMPMKPMKSAVIAPMMITKDSGVSDSSNSGDRRATMKMPAVTMVAAWISAEIGVGPSIESGSHTCKGTCADLPIAPMNRQMHTMVATCHGWPEKISTVRPAIEGSLALANTCA